MTSPDEQFREFYGRYYVRLLRYFRRTFQVSESDALDLAQDTFLRFYRSIGEYRGEAEWALLETIARHVGYNRIRSQLTQKRVAAEESLESSLEAAALPGDPATGDEFKSPELRVVEREAAVDLKRRLREAIASLPVGQRACLALWLDDLSYEEIASTLRISLDAVKSRIRDARKELKRRLGNNLFEPFE